ncbi:hypothetical protein SAMN05216167_1014 [Spirosoma endophyticum]|uniref:Uncharacterized protein n=1 Tax=Spirosoma endophyticum TaxID=662367 RepID=A0A1I1EM32_9BACT|nr:hypothetical protein SAMN05216167_1014 [Spirosoma endophyticum]
MRTTSFARFIERLNPVFLAYRHSALAFIKTSKNERNDGLLAWEAKQMRVLTVNLLRK